MTVGVGDKYAVVFATIPHDDVLSLREIHHAVGTDLIVSGIGEHRRSFTA